ncbi:MAG TPA: 50S ribosomal protein L21 [Candidatus Sulfotelmatobacter sp.]|jgi:large subunit ribosomal protein L21|nr:50S ribosomal protein L21 [Candidatus Sulfotelmatobacter sp.]
MKYAVITSGGKQYKVTEGQVLELDRLKADPGSNYTLDKVLLTVDGDSVQVGAPYLENVSVIAKVLEQIKGDKIRVAKFKAKARYRKVQGFRAQLTKVEIISLSGKSEKKIAPKEEVEK